MGGGGGGGGGGEREENFLTFGRTGPWGGKSPFPTPQYETLNLDITG